jgi:hypothetical protein
MFSSTIKPRGYATAQQRQLFGHREDDPIRFSVLARPSSTDGRRPIPTAKLRFSPLACPSSAYSYNDYSYNDYRTITPTSSYAHSVDHEDTIRFFVLVCPSSTNGDRPIPTAKLLNDYV